MKSTTFWATGFAFALALPAVAAPVSYAGLDANKPEDVAAFSARLDDAAKEVCKDQPGVQLIGVRRVGCEEMVKQSAVAKLPEAWREAVVAKPARKTKPIQLAEAAERGA